MTKDRSTAGSAAPSWPDRLKQVLSREPADKAQLLELLRAAHQRELLDADALAIIVGVLLVYVLGVRYIMLPVSLFFVL
jgi:magnesium and cobalt transporter